MFKPATKFRLSLHYLGIGEASLLVYFLAALRSIPGSIRDTRLLCYIAIVHDAADKSMLGKKNRIQEENIQRYTFRLVKVPLVFPTGLSARASSLAN